MGIFSKLTVSTLAEHSKSKEAPPIAKAIGNIPEHPEQVELKVDGEIPDWLDGVLYRLSPGTFDIVTNKRDRRTRKKKVVSLNHWFDGLAQLHRFQIVKKGTDGAPEAKVIWSSRNTASQIEDGIIKTGKLPTRVTFGNQQDPCDSMYRKFQSSFEGGTTVAKAVMEGTLATIIGQPQKMPLDKGFNVNVAVDVGEMSGGLIGSGTDETDIAPKYIGPAPQCILRTDANVLQQVEPDTMAPKRLFAYTDLNPDITGMMSAAHAQYDPVTKQEYNFTLTFGPTGNTYTVFYTSYEHPKGMKVGDITVSKASYIHSFGMTENYIIMGLWPLYFGWCALNLMYSGSFSESVEYRGDLPTEMHIMSRATGEVVQVFDAASLFCFHTINAFEVPSPGDPNSVDIMFDLCALKDDSVIRGLHRTEILKPNYRAADIARFRRYRLTTLPKYPKPSTTTTTRKSKKTAAPHPEAISYMEFLTNGIDLPVINPAYRLRPYRYVYGVTATDGTIVNSILKIDLDALAKTTTSPSTTTPHTNDAIAKIWGREGTWYASEPIFVARPDAIDEDDGVLLSVVFDVERVQSFMVVLDARDLSELARAYLADGDKRLMMPLGFHGNFANGAIGKAKKV